MIFNDIWNGIWYGSCGINLPLECSQHNVGCTCQWGPGMLFIPIALVSSILFLYHKISVYISSKEST